MSKCAIIGRKRLLSRTIGSDRWSDSKYEKQAKQHCKEKQRGEFNDGLGEMA